jgi:prepilin-type N-terminal cleavage/methylation domain-containing protein
MRFASTGSRAASRLPRSTSAAANGAAGFTLLETLAAMTILAMALVALFDAQSRGVRAAGAADDYVRARLLGQALLADAVTGWPETGLASSSGSEGRFNWSIEVAPSEAGWVSSASDRDERDRNNKTNANEKDNKDAKNDWRLNRVHVAVTWDRDRRVVLDTLKLGRVEANE